MKNTKYTLSYFMMALCVCALSFLFSTSAGAQNNSRSLILSDNYSEHYLSPYLIKYEDIEGKLDVEQVISTLNLTAEISQTTGSITSLKTHGHTIWLIFNLMNRASEESWSIDFGTSFSGRFGLFDKVESYTFSKEFKEITENFINEHGYINLNLPIDQKSQVILKLKSTSGIPLTTPIRVIKTSSIKDAPVNASLFLCIALLIGMAFFFSSVSFMQSNNNYFYFSTYYLLLTALIIIQNNYVTIELPVLGSAIIPFLYLCVSIVGLFIARIFWSMDDKPKIINVAFFFLIAFCLASFVGGLTMPIGSSAVKYGLLFGPSLLILTLIPLICIIQTQNSNNQLTAFMFGWFILLFGACITILALSNFMQPVSTAINSLWFSLVPQALFFIFATKIKIKSETLDSTTSKTLEINENDSVSKLRQSKENTEQARLLKVIEQERKVLTELRKSEARQTNEMRAAKDIADEANKAKSAFLAVVSHEIRTPMTGIMGMVRLLLDSNLTKDQKEYAQTIQDSSDAMLALLNDILDFEKIEQGKMAFENISFDIHRLVHGVVTLMNGHASQKNIDLKTKIGENLPRYVRGDPTRLRQVLLNLTGNAVKFTSKGYVTITAELMGESDDLTNCEIYFGVTDSGIGISKEAQKDLFSPFSQADNSISRKFGGTGLGLAISKGLIDGMGSSININSNEGEGSTFFFTLNMPKGQGTTPRESANQTIETKTDMAVLIVDDNKINQKVVQGFLADSPHRIKFCDSAEEALEELNSAPYDLVLMDIELPMMNGDKATIELRKSANEKLRNIPVIALTGNMMPDDIEQYYASGMNGFIGKPIDPDTLSSTIMKASQNIFENPSMAVKETPAENKKEIKSTPIKVQQTPIEIKKPQIENKEIMTKEPITAKPEKQNDAAPKKAEVLKPDTLETLKGHITKPDIEEMLNDVITKTEEIFDGMNEALKNNDMEVLSAKGHELRGMAGNFGLMEISEQAGEVEEKAKTSPSIILTGLVSPIADMKKRAEEALNLWISENID